MMMRWCPVTHDVRVVPPSWTSGLQQFEEINVKFTSLLPGVNCRGDSHRSHVPNLLHRVEAVSRVGFKRQPLSRQPPWREPLGSSSSSRHDLAFSSASFINAGAVYTIDFVRA